MSTPLQYTSETERLSVLRRIGILDSPPEREYDEVVELAARMCDMPLAFIVLVDESRQFIKAKVGFDIDEVPREGSFSSHCIRDYTVLEVKDALADDRFISHPMVTEEPHVRFFAGAPLMTADGYALGTLCVLDDKPRELTGLQKNTLESLAEQVMAKMESRVSNHKLRQNYTELQSAHHRLKQHFQMVAHDLRSPFNGLLGITDLLTNNYHAYTMDEVLQIIKTLNRATSETYVMLENLLEWSNFEVGVLGFDPVVIDVSEMIEKSISVLAPMVERKGIELKISVAEGATIYTDELMIASVVRNLVSNSIKFTHGKGAVRFNVHPHEQGLLFEIIDNGIGMESAQVEAVCAAQSIKSIMGTDGERGSGVGLMLIHQFLAKHSSKLELSSVVDRGTTVRFILPIAK